MMPPLLNLLPAMKALFLNSLVLLAAAASAQTPDREMARCAALSDAAARLACLDKLAAEAVARLQPAAQAAAQAKAQEQAFGAPPPKPVAARPEPGAGPAPAPNVIESEIEGFVEGWRPNQQFRLKNGQIWRVTETTSGDVGLNNPKVRVRRNFMGTYFLEFVGRNDSPKVRRVE